MSCAQDYSELGTPSRCHPHLSKLSPLINGTNPHPNPNSSLLRRFSSLARVLLRAYTLATQVRVLHALSKPFLHLVARIDSAWIVNVVELPRSRMLARTRAHWRTHALGWPSSAASALSRGRPAQIPLRQAEHSTNNSATSGNLRTDPPLASHGGSRYATGANPDTTRRG